MLHPLFHYLWYVANMSTTRSDAQRGPSSHFPPCKMGFKSTQAIQDRIPKHFLHGAIVSPNLHHSHQQAVLSCTGVSNNIYTTDARRSYIAALLSAAHAIGLYTWTKLVGALLKWNLVQSAQSHRRHKGTNMTHAYRQLFSSNSCQHSLCARVSALWLFALYCNPSTAFPLYYLLYFVSFLSRHSGLHKCKTQSRTTRPYSKAHHSCLPWFRWARKLNRAPNFRVNILK